MLKFTHKLKLTVRVAAKCKRHPGYNPEKEGRNVKGSCSTCFELFDLFQSRNQLAAAVRDFERRAAPWHPPTKPRKPTTTTSAPEAQA